MFAEKMMSSRSFGIKLDGVTTYGLVPYGDMSNHRAHWEG